MFEYVSYISYVRKFLVALAAATGVLVVALSDDSVSASEWLQILLAFAGALGVYATTNEPTKE